MKLARIYTKVGATAVTLRVRVWIETVVIVLLVSFSTVTLRVRVWIETWSRLAALSLLRVTLRVRVWIETRCLRKLLQRKSGHPPREGVD